jgi:hypothetical protein
MPGKIKLAEIVGNPEKGSFQIKRGSESFSDYDPNKKNENLLWKGDVLKVPLGVTVKVRPERDKKLEWPVTDAPYWVVSQWCYPAPSSAEKYLKTTQLTTPAKLGEISEYSIGKKFKIKRHAWADFKDYNPSTWGLGLYEGDRLKVPPV